uniref:G-protein coupled receptors family 1 profile domain-containing protein n=1 Tax=Lepisosteus oculatus TaxID=7918 RepID=W5LY45_LEPOC
SGKQNINDVSHLFVGLTLPLSLSLLFLLGIFNILILCNLRSSRAGLRPPGGRVSGPTARALVSMGVADTALCMTAAPTVLLSDLGVPFPFYPCLLLSCTVLGWAMVSSFHHVLMAYYRWKLITQPHSSRGRQAWSSSLFPLSLCWVAGVAISCLPYLGYNNYPNLQAASYSAAACAGSPSSCRVPCIYQNVLSLTYLTYVVFLCGVTLPLGVTCLLYCLAFRAIRAHCRGRALLSPPASSAPRAPSHNSLFYLRQRRVARLTALLFGLYVLSRLPFNLLNAVMLLCPSCPVPYWAPPLAILCAVFSAASNPLIYLVRGE